jgi:hypothetical protein
VNAAPKSIFVSSEVLLPTVSSASEKEEHCSQACSGWYSRRLLVPVVISTLEYKVKSPVDENKNEKRR